MKKHLSVTTSFPALALGAILFFTACGSESTTESTTKSMVEESEQKTGDEEKETMAKEMPEEVVENMLEDSTAKAMEEPMETPEVQEVVEEVREVMEPEPAKEMFKGDERQVSEGMPGIEEVVEQVEAAPKTGEISHEPLDRLLKKYVSSAGKVNYKGIKTEASALNAYIGTLSANHPDGSWTKSQAKAFWINVYNAYTLKLIVDNYPVKSITDINNGKPWDLKNVKIGGKTYNLDQVENEILRPTYKDGRVHFAINCASFSCPILLNRAFTPANLERNLEKVTKAFMNDQARNKVSDGQVSQIFNWFKGDFEKDGKSVIDFINTYADAKIDGSTTLQYLEYDWSLNE